MKKILLSSAAVALLAGAASAEVTWSGDAELGYNDDYNDGIFWDAGLGVAMSQELNNGWTASASLDIDLTEGDAFDLGDVSSSDWVLALSNDVVKLSAGDIDLASSFFDFVSEADNDIEGTEASDFEDLSDDVQAGVMVEGDFDMAKVALSAVVDDEGDAEALQFYAGGEFGVAKAGLLYNDEDDRQAGATLVSLGATLGGADLLFNAGEVADITIYGIEVDYPVGPVTVGAYYLKADVEGDVEDDAYGLHALYNGGPLEAKVYYKDNFGVEEYGLGATYDMGTGLTLSGGYIDGDDETDDDFATYVVADYDLGGGASILASYADANSGSAVDTDDIDTVTGDYELKSGTTLALNFEF